MEVQTAVETKSFTLKKNAMDLSIAQKNVCKKDSLKSKKKPLLTLP